MKYKAVIFDLFGTLVDSYPQNEFDALLYDMADSVSVEREFFKKTWIETNKLRFIGKLNIKQSIEFCVEKAGIIKDVNKVESAYEKMLKFLKEHVIPRPDVIETFEKLHDLGLKIGLISDCASSLVDMWDELSFSGLIDEPVFSCNVGIKKPAPEIYHIALDRLKLEAKECLYVGDGGSFELTGAENVGMTAIMIDGNKNSDVVRYEVQEWSGVTITAISQVLNHLN